MDLVEHVYRATASFPTHEKYGLSSQMQRAAVSVPSNVAEGYRRQYRKEYLQHLSIAHGSLAELDTQLEIARRLEYLAAGDHDEIDSLMQSLGKQLYALTRRLSTTSGRPKSKQ